MNKTVLYIIAILAVVAAVVMYYVGSTSSHLSELEDFWYIPLPLALIALLAAFRKSTPKE